MPKAQSQGKSHWSRRSSTQGAPEQRLQPQPLHILALCLGRWGFPHLSNRGQDSCPAHPLQASCALAKLTPSHLCKAHSSVSITSARRGGEAAPTLHTAQFDSLPQKSQAWAQKCAQADMQTFGHTQRMHMQMGTHTHKHTACLHTQMCTTY